MSTAAETFDPYREWLGIELRDMPPDHYRLLGLMRFETDAGKIQDAADGRMKAIRGHQTGPRGVHTHKLLNELSTAKLCLLSPESKAQYDQSLREKLLRMAPLAVFPAQQRSFAPAYMPLAQPYVFPAGVPALEPPLAAPPVAKLPGPPQAPPKPARKSELAIDEDHVPEPPENGDEEAPPPSRLQLIAGMALATIVVAGLTWGAGVYFSRSKPDETKAGGGETSPGESEEQKAPPEDPAAKAIVVMQEGSGNVSLPPATAILSGALELRPAGTESVVSGWNSETDSALWKFKLIRPGYFNMELIYAAADEANDSRIELLLDDEPLHKFVLHTTGSTEKFDTLSHTIVIKASGTQVLTVRPTVQIPAGSLVIKTIRLVPVGKTP